jgi:hypothetical protein
VREHLKTPRKASFTIGGCRFCLISTRGCKYREFDKTAWNLINYYDRYSVIIIKLKCFSSRTEFVSLLQNQP